ncbi:hypothetical protein L1887_13731 [Cichorium endivia]|nr:hypothetical protein L1887_13731 [Cichorium endivia]
MSTILPWVIGLVGGVVFLFGIACAFVLYMCYSKRLHKSRISKQQWTMQSFHQIGFSEIDKATNKFGEAQVIGKGAFGKVYRLLRKTQRRDPCCYQAPERAPRPRQGVQS